MSTVEDENEAAILDTRLLAAIPGVPPSQSAQRALAAAASASFDAAETADGDGATGG